MGVFFKPSKTDPAPVVDANAVLAVTITLQSLQPADQQIPRELPESLGSGTSGSYVKSSTLRVPPSMTGAGWFLGMGARSSLRVYHGQLKYPIMP
jgi:hypothetical protein